MTAFDPTNNPTNEVLTASVVVDDINTNLDRIQAKFVEVANCLRALDPTGPAGPVDPGTGDMTNIPLVFKTVTDENGNTQIVQASVTSTTAFQNDLNGLTINAGEAIIASTSNPNAFGTNVGRGDALFAKVNNPTQDLSNTTDWLRLEGDDSYSLTLSERQFINTLNTDDVPVRQTDASTETTVTFYLLSTAATVDGDLTGGQVGSFRQTTDQQNGILYTRMPSNYVPLTGEDRLYVEIVDPGGTVSTFAQLSTYTERTDLLVAGDDVYESAGGPFGTAINYRAGQVIKLWRTRLSREWYFNAAFDVLRGLPNNSIPIEKLDPATQAQIREHGQQTSDIQSLLARVNTLWPLALDVNILTDWADIYNPEQTSETVRIVPPYIKIADFRGTASTQHYESAGVTYTDGVDVIDYSGLGSDSPRMFGARVAAAANQTLVSLGNGGSVIPFIGITAAGNLRLNDFTPARTQDEVVTDHYARTTLSSGTGTLTAGGSVSTYTVPDYPTNTSEQTRSISADFEILVNGVDTRAAAAIGEINGFVIPNTVTAQARRTINHVGNLGPLHGNRQVSFTIGYAFRVSGSDLLLDLDLDSAPSDVTLHVNNATTFQSYTATAVIARVDNWQNFQNQFGNFTFSGDHEFLIEIIPRPGDGSQLQAVGAAINTTTGATTEFNDIFFAVPPVGFDEVQIPDTIEFRTFASDHYLSHSGLVTLLGDRLTEWCYGTARREVVTTHDVTEPINLHKSSSLNGALFSQDISSTAIGGTGNSVLTLPEDYTDYEIVALTITEDGGQLMNQQLLTRELEDNATIANVRIAGNDFADWDRVKRELTLHETADTYTQALLFVPRVS